MSHSVEIELYKLYYTRVHISFTNKISNIQTNTTRTKEVTK